MNAWNSDATYLAYEGTLYYRDNQGIYIFVVTYSFGFNVFHSLKKRIGAA